MKILDFLKNKVSYQKKLKILYYLRGIKGKLHRNSLSKLADIHKTDKNNYHFYTQHYERHFKEMQNSKIILLEIGVGGYEDPYIGGNSLRMWKSFFSKAKISSVDIYDKSFLEEKRIKIFKGSQVDKGFLDSVCKITGNFDIIIDDGSHINSHVIKTFKLLFPKLKSGGIYVVEDTQTSYWEEYGGSMIDETNTIYGYFKNLINGLNHKEFIFKNYKPSYFDETIISMHFYHNLIFIHKGENNEPSNKVRNNQFK